MEQRYWIIYFSFNFRMPAQPPAENGAGPPKSELEELQIRANTVTDEVIVIYVTRRKTFF